MDLNSLIPVRSNVISFPINPLTQVTSSGEFIAAGPIEAEMRAKLAKLKDCKYPDEFDWSVYDRIASKFETPPRGGAFYNQTFKLVNWHPSCTHCHYAFEVDTYGRGCFHDCTYCYAKEQLTSHGYWNNPQPFPINLAEIRKIFYTVFETDKPNKWREVLQKKVPLRIGSMSDSFMWTDTKYGVTKEFLKILNFYRYPYLIFTRSDLVAHDDYLGLLDRSLCSVQMSIAGNNNKLIRKIEPGAPNYSRRLAALTKLMQAKIWTAVRINPLFPRHPDGYLSGTYSPATAGPTPTLDLYNDQFVPELAAAGVKTVLVGFVRLSPWSVKAVSQSLGVDLKSFFKDQQGDRRYSDAEIAAYYKIFHDACTKSGVRFSTCYIGNGVKDYFQYQKMWSNAGDCCDVVGNVSNFKTTCQSISQDSIEKNRKQITRQNQTTKERHPGEPMLQSVPHLSNQIQSPPAPLL